MPKIATPLNDELENLAHHVIGCCVTVHRELGPGLLESIYTQAVVFELPSTA